LTTDVKVLTEPPRRESRLRRLVEAVRWWFYVNRFAALAALSGAAAGAIILFLRPQEDDPMQRQWNEARGKIVLATSHLRTASTDIQRVGTTENGLQVYSSSSVIFIAEGYRRELLAPIPSELVGMRDYVNDSFTKGSSLLSRNEVRLANRQCDGCVPENAVAAFFSYLSGLGEGLAKIDRITVDLQTNSNPSEATAQILYLSDTPYRSNTTDGKLRNVYRGRYKARVSLANHKTGTYDDINLIEDPRKTLECTLPAVTDPASASCRMKD
jgi:hypothetical protein